MRCAKFADKSRRALRRAYMHASPSAFNSLHLPHLLFFFLSLSLPFYSIAFSHRRLFEFLPLYMRKASFFFFLIGAALQLCLHQRGDLKLPLCVCACVCVFVSYLINPSLFHRCRVTIDWPYRTRLSLTLKKKKPASYTLGTYSSSAFPYLVVYSKFSLYSVLQLTQKQN